MITNHKLKSLVLSLLTKHPELRDDDRRLCVNVWNCELKFRGRDGSSMSTFEFFEAFKQGIVSHAESIRRQRQKLQELNKELRGQRYQERHKKLEPEVREAVQLYI